MQRRVWRWTAHDPMHHTCMPIVVIYNVHIPTVFLDPWCLPHTPEVFQDMLPVLNALSTTTPDIHAHMTQPCRCRYDPTRVKPPARMKIFCIEPSTHLFTSQTYHRRPLPGDRQLRPASSLKPSCSPQRTWPHIGLCTHSLPCSSLLLCSRPVCTFLSTIAIT